MPDSSIAPGAEIVGVDIFGPASPDGEMLAAFYREKLGMRQTGEGGQTNAEFEFPDGTTFGVYQPPGAKLGGGYTALFAVGDIDAAVARFRALGAELSDPMETPVCWLSFGTDPEGNPYALHQRKTAPPVTPSEGA